MDLRGQVGRLPGGLPPARRRGRAAEQDGKGSHRRFEPVARALPRALRTPDCVLDGEVCALDEHGRPSFARDAAGLGDARHRALRPARARGSALGRSPPHGTAGTAGATRRPGRAEGPVLGSLRRRSRAARRSRGTGPRGDHGQAGRLAIPAGQADTRLAQGEVPPVRGVRRRRLHEGRGTTRRSLRGARPRCTARLGSRLGRKLRHRLHRGRDRAPAPEAPRARAEDLSAGCRPEDAAGAPRRRRVGHPEAGGGDPVRRVDARGPSACTLLQGAPGRQGPGTDRARATAGDRDPAGLANTSAVQPRQGLLARRGDHEGRSPRLLPEDRSCARPAPAPQAVHDEALPRRDRGRPLLPEGRAGAHAVLDRDGGVPGELEGRQALADDSLSAGRRRARPPLDGEHGLHRHERLVLACRPAGAPGLRPLRPRSGGRRRISRDRAGRAPRAVVARRGRARELREDERLGRDPRARPGRAAPRATRTPGASRSSSHDLWRAPTPVS